MLRKLSLTSLLATAMLLCSSCSIMVQFFVANRSEQPLRVIYTLKQAGDFDPPSCVAADALSGTLEIQECDEQIFSFDPEARTATATLEPGRAIRIESMDAFYVERQPDPHFSVETLRLVQPGGEQTYHGERVFRAFAGKGYDWFTGTARYYEIEYR